MPSAALRFIDMLFSSSGFPSKSVIVLEVVLLSTSPALCRDFICTDTAHVAHPVGLGAHDAVQTHVRKGQARLQKHVRELEADLHFCPGLAKASHDPVRRLLDEKGKSRHPVDPLGEAPLDLLEADHAPTSQSPAPPPPNP